MKEYNVNVDYSECITVKAKSAKDAERKAIKQYEKNAVSVYLADEAEFTAEEIV